MARLIHRLDTQKVKQATAPGYYADGGGLYLQVGRAGARSWVYRFRFAGRTREMGLGGLAMISLAEARQAARGARALLSEGKDPIAVKKAEAVGAGAVLAHAPTFREEADAFIAAHEAGWRNEKHGEQWRSTLTTYAYPVIGAMAVADVTTEEIARILEPIWREKTETAKRVRGRIEAVLARAAARGHRQAENPARWSGHFEHILPAPAVVAPVRHHAAMPFAEMPEFMARLRAQGGLAARALELTIICATRTIESIGARIVEFDLGHRIWTIPAGRMKRGRAHRVPLPARAVELVAALHPDAGGFIFPGGAGAGHLSTAAMLALLGRMGCGNVTVHGFRSTFKDWTLESTSFAPHLSEMALSHAVKDKTEAAYRRGDLLEQRRPLMESWAEFCCRGSATLAVA